MDNWIEANRVNFTDDELYDLDRAKRNRVIALFGSFAVSFWASRKFLKIQGVQDYLAEGQFGKSMLWIAAGIPFAACFTVDYPLRLRHIDIKQELFYKYTEDKLKNTEEKTEDN